MAERAEDRGREKVAQDMPSSHRSRALAVQDAALRGGHGDGPEASLVVGDFRAYRALDRIGGVGMAVAVDHVDSAAGLRGGPGVVGDHTVPGDGDGQLDHDRLVKAVHVDLMAVGPVRNGPNGLPHGLFAALDDSVRKSLQVG